MKHPRFRFASLKDCDQSSLDVLKDIFTRFLAVLPLPKGVTISAEVVGSNARQCAALYSDLDIHLAAGDDWKNVQMYFKSHQKETEVAFNQLIADLRPWGLRPDISMEGPGVKFNPKKRCYDLIEGVWYGLADQETKKRWDYNPGTSAWFERQPKVLLRPPKHRFGTLDDEATFHEGVDVFASEVPLYRKPGFIELPTVANTVYG